MYCTFTLFSVVFLTTHVLHCAYKILHDGGSGCAVVICHIAEKSLELLKSSAAVLFFSEMDAFDWKLQILTSPPHVFYGSQCPPFLWLLKHCTPGFAHPKPYDSDKHAFLIPSISSVVSMLKALDVKSSQLLQIPHFNDEILKSLAQQVFFADVQCSKYEKTEPLIHVFLERCTCFTSGKNLCGVSNQCITPCVWIKGTAWKARMQLGKLGNCSKASVFFLLVFFFDCFQAVSKNSPLSRFWLSDCQCAFLLQKPWEITVVLFVMHQFREITIWPTPWRGFSVDTKTSTLAEYLQKDKEQRKAGSVWRMVEMGCWIGTVWIDMNWYELIRIVLPLHGSPPPKNNHHFFKIKLMSLVYGQWWDWWPIALWQGLSSMTADQIADVEVHKLPFVGCEMRDAKQQFFLRHIVTG